VEGEPTLDVVLLGSLVDSLVDSAEDFFVPCSSLREIHPAIIARRLEDAPFIFARLPRPLTDDGAEVTRKE
jgi:hypothetical protein